MRVIRKGPRRRWSMALPQRVQQFLNENRVTHQAHTHPVAYTAQHVAAEEHVSGRAFAKVVMVKGGGKAVMAVLPASYRIDTASLAAAMNVPKVEVMTEAEFGSLFPDCDLGAMPPFGNLYNVPVYVDQSLSEEQEVSFQAGSHTEVVRMRYADYARLVKPTVAKFLGVLR